MSQPIQGIREIVAQATQGMTPAHLDFRPDPGKWSSVEILEHLMLTYTGTVKGMQRCLEANRPLVTSRSWKQRLLIHLISRRGYFPEGKEAPKHVRPKGTPAEEVLPRLYASLDELDAAIDAAEQRFGRGPVLDHPLLGAMSAEDWRGFHASHARHHMKQIVALRAAAMGEAHPG